MVICAPHISSSTPNADDPKLAVSRSFLRAKGSESDPLPGKQVRFPRIRSEIGLARGGAPAKPHEPYDNEVSERWTAEIAEAASRWA
jgi:hypothetical protein